MNSTGLQCLNAVHTYPSSHARPVVTNIQLTSLFRQAIPSRLCALPARVLSMYCARTPCGHASRRAENRRAERPQTKNCTAFSVCVSEFLGRGASHDARHHRIPATIKSHQSNPENSAARSTFQWSTPVTIISSLHYTLALLHASFCTRHIEFVRDRQVRLPNTPHTKQRCPSHSRPCQLAPLWLCAQLAHNGTVLWKQSCSFGEGVSSSCRC